MLCILILGCASVSDVPSLPERMRTLQGFGEIRISLKGLKYEGEVSVDLEYPGKLTASFYGPFGEVEAFLRADSSSFIFLFGEQTIEDKNAFEKILQISLEGFIEAFLMGEGTGGLKRKKRGRDVCVSGKSGEICIRFSEVKAFPS